MFTHRGQERTHSQNLSLASFLAFVAGMVNVTGFLAIGKLTTNVTGHLAHLIHKIFVFNFSEALFYFLFLLFFLGGSFFSGVLVELADRRKSKQTYLIPLLIEAIIILAVALIGNYASNTYPQIIAFLLLFSMGIQNSLVTNISNSVVRTTHLTGLFTDMGIELAQLFFYREKAQKSKLINSISLRITIILSFFFGGIIAGLLFQVIGIYVLYLVSLFLFSGILVNKLLNR